ncbi:MAG: hypothetical protein PHD70_13905 [Anaerostipes sp.]|jgi:hypothetical protein|nr:hypothetical protein [Anaerostipes sp.]MDD3747551.1 hypothetical protein [Anaerostipes sp.]
MKQISLLLTGGMKQEKAEKIMGELKEELQKKQIEAQVSFVNLFENSDLSGYSDSIDLIINVGTGTLDTNLPVVGGLGLLYGYLSTTELYSEIESRAVEQ